METVGVDIETQDNQTWCTGWANSSSRVAVRKLFLPEGRPVFHNGKYDMSFLDPNGVHWGLEYFDTIIEAALLGYRPLNLPFLASTFLGVTLDKTAVKERNTVRFEDRPEGEVLNMCSMDAWASWALHDLWKDKVAKYEDLYLMERKITRILMDVERRGIPVSQPKLKIARGEILSKMSRLEDVLEEGGLSPIDPDGFARWFWKGKEKIVTTKTSGELSTAKAVLRENATEKDSPLTEAFIKWKSLDKFKSTYIDAWSGKDTIHPSLNQTGTVVWRFSCSNPNLQNVPHHGNDDIPLYTLFEAPEGYTFISADYSQLQLRVLANLTQDPKMIAAYLGGSDLHQATQDLLEKGRTYKRLGITNPDHKRRIAKDTNFGIIFDISAYSLAPRLGVTKAQAQEIIDGFLGNYSAVGPWQELQRGYAASHGYVETFLGRPIYVPGMLSERGRLRAHADKQAINGPVIGGEAEVVKSAMIRCPEYMVNQVHDEILYLVPNNELEDYKGFLAEKLIDYRHDVPYTVTIETGRSWGAIKHMEDLWQEDEDD